MNVTLAYIAIDEASVTKCFKIQSSVQYYNSSFPPIICQDLYDKSKKAKKNFSYNA